MKLESDNKKIICNESEFLIKKCKHIYMNDYSIRYIFSDMEIKIFVEPMSNESGVQVYYNKQNKNYDIAWIAIARDNLEIPMNSPIKKITILLQYLKRNYNKLTNINYCEESEKYIREYFEERRNIYKQTVADFLNNS